MTDKSFDRSNNDTFYSVPPKHKGISTYYITSDSEQEQSPLHDSNEDILPLSQRTGNLEDSDLPFGAEKSSKLQLPLNAASDATVQKEIQQAETPQIRLVKMAEKFPNLFQWMPLVSEMIIKLIQS